MNKAALEQKSRKELLAIAKENKIRGYSSCTKAQLVEMILSHSDSKPAPKRKPGKKSAQSNLEVQGGSRKFEMQDAAHRAEPEYPVDEERELPEGYGETRIVTMVRDPYWLFAYWEISHSKRQELGLLGNHNRPMLLRVYDVTDILFNGFNAHSSFDIEINDMANNWYIKVPEPNRSYCVDLATYNEAGGFQLIARSNSALTPRDGLSEQVDEEWGAAAEQLDELNRISADYKSAEIADRNVPGPELSSGGVYGLSSGALSSGALSSGELSSGVLSSGELSSWGGSSEQFSSGALYNLSSGELYNLSSGQTAELSSGALYNLSSGELAGLSSGELAELSSGGIYTLSSGELSSGALSSGELSSGALSSAALSSGELSSWGGSSEQLSSGAPVTGSSGTPGEAANWNPDLRLDVKSEIVIYGNAAPGSRITIQGHEVQVRPDGSFTARFAVPDGDQVIPIKTVSPSGRDEKQLTTMISKRTTVEKP